MCYAAMGAVECARLCQDHPYQLRKPPRYVYSDSERRKVIGRRRRERSSNVPVDILGARVTNDDLVEFEVAWRHPARKTWETEASIVSDYKALVDAYEQRRVDSGPPLDVFAEGLRNAKARRVAKMNWSRAEWARRVHQADGQAARASVLDEYAKIKGSTTSIDAARRSVVIQVCYVKVESLDA